MVVQGPCRVRNLNIIWLCTAPRRSQNKCTKRSQFGLCFQHKVKTKANNRPIADLTPSKRALEPPRKFGTLKGKAKIIDPNWAAPMTDAEADAFIEGRY
jgi:hypothetical protein